MTEKSLAEEISLLLSVTSVYDDGKSSICIFATHFSVIAFVKR